MVAGMQSTSDPMYIPTGCFCAHCGSTVIHGDQCLFCCGWENGWAVRAQSRCGRFRTSMGVLHHLQRHGCVLWSKNQSVLRYVLDVLGLLVLVMYTDRWHACMQRNSSKARIYIRIYIHTYMHIHTYIHAYTVILAWYGRSMLCCGAPQQNTCIAMACRGGWGNACIAPRCVMAAPEVDKGLIPSVP